MKATYPHVCYAILLTNTMENMEYGYSFSCFLPICYGFFFVT